MGRRISRAQGRTYQTGATHNGHGSEAAGKVTGRKAAAHTCECGRETGHRMGDPITCQCGRCYGAWGARCPWMDVKVAA